jgi:hypothetical protein
MMQGRLTLRVGLSSYADKTIKFGGNCINYGASI